MAVPQWAASLRGFVSCTRRWLLITVACAAVAGCTTAPRDPDVITAAPDPTRAIIIGWGNTPAENARAALTPEPRSRVSRLFVAKANAQKISFGENIARLPPGEYELTISCGIYLDYRFFTHETVMRATVDANRVYRLRAEPEGRRCGPFLEDVTGKDR